MEIIQSIVLGIVQGLGEFLPISSTAHLILVPYFFGWPDPGLTFDVALHVGTLIAVVLFFGKDWMEIFKLAFGIKSDQKETYPSNLLWLLVIASIPGAIFGFLLEDYAENFFRHPLLIALSLSIMGLILYVADKYSRRTKGMQEINWKNSLYIGLSQAVAIIPGVSRSGATITAGLFSGLDRVSAAKFSFLLSTPIIFGAAALKLPELWQNGWQFESIIAILISAFSGYLAIKFMLKFIEKVSYKIFFWYRLILAGIIIIVYFIK